MKVLLISAAGVAGFVIAYHSGSKTKAILIPAGIAGVLTMVPVLADPKALGFFGVIGLVVFILLSSLPSVLSAGVGCLVGVLLRKPSKSTPLPSGRKWAAIGLLFAVAIFTSMQAAKGDRQKGLESVAEASGGAFLQRQSEVLSKTGSISRISVSSKGHNADGFPSINFFVDGELADADVRVDVSGTQEAPVFTVRSVEPRPSIGLTTPSSGTR